jgi:hypothetical protein
MWDSVIFAVCIIGEIAINILNPLLIQAMISLVTKKSTTPEFYSNLNIWIPYSVALAFALGLARFIQQIFISYTDILRHLLLLNHRNMLKGTLFKHAFRIKLSAENVSYVNVGL